MKLWASFAAFVAALGSVAPVAHAAGFTYHGSLVDGGQPADGSYDIRVTPYASEHAAAPAAAPVTLYGVKVSDGRFSTDLDFAANVAPDGWLGVAVRKAGSGEFVDLAGRTEIAATDVCWSTAGNSGLVSGSFIGTLDATPLYMRVNNHFGAGIRTYDTGPTTGVSFEVGNATASAARSAALNWGLAAGVDSFAGGYSGQVMAGHDRSFVWGGTHAVDRVQSTGADEFDVWADGGFNARTGPFSVWADSGFRINTSNWGFSDDVVIAPHAGVGSDPDVDIRLISRNGKNGLITLRDSDGRMDLSAMGGVHIIGPVLRVEGEASKLTAGAWQANSDGRIKQDIAPIGDALDTLAKIRPVTFRYTDAYRAEHPQVADQRYYNVIAQEFATVFPDAVTKSGEFLPGAAKTADNEILQVDTYPAQIVTIAAVQELAQKNAALEATVQKLAARLARLEAKGE